MNLVRMVVIPNWLLLIFNYAKQFLIPDFPQKPSAGQKFLIPNFSITSQPHNLPHGPFLHVPLYDSERKTTSESKR